MANSGNFETNTNLYQNEDSWLEFYNYNVTEIFTLRLEFHNFVLNNPA